MMRSITRLMRLCTRKIYQRTLSVIFCCSDKPVHTGRDMCLDHYKESDGYAYGLFAAMLAAT